MPQKSLFISDLHLQEKRPDLTAALISFLARNRGQADALYILGDLFELWVGDDLNSTLADSVASHLKAFAASGAKVYLMHGNRDFLIGTVFAARCGASLIHEPYLLRTPRGQICLLHGDILCTDDIEYQQFRTLVRSQAWQQEFLSKPLDQRLAFADQAGAQSRESTATKSNSIMDVNENAVREFITANAAPIILHGHTHRPAVHQIGPAESDTPSQRIVLGDWDENGWYVEISPDGIMLESFAIETS